MTELMINIIGAVLFGLFISLILVEKFKADLEGKISFRPVYVIIASIGLALMFY